MSISDNLNSIRTHLEDDYTALETLGVTVQDRNIENIKDMANQIYAKFPKTEYGEGSSVTLENTLKGKLDYDNGIVGYGDTSQEGTPTPTTPIPIEVVTGEQEVTVRGKNLFNDVLETGSINSSGNNTSSTTNIRSKDYTNVKPNTTYTLSCNVSSNIALRFYNSSGTFLSSGTTQSGTSNTFTTPDNCTKFRFVLAENTDLTTKVQLETGTERTTYEPYITPITKQLSLGDIELAKIPNTNYRDYFVTDRNTGKWYKKNIVGKKIYSAINNFTNLGSYSRVSILFDTGKGASASVTNSLSNVSIYKAAYSEQSSHQYASASAIYWFIQNSSIGETISKETIETYISSLSVTPEFYYVLATPTDTEITDTSLINQLEDIYNMQSVNGTTIIEVSGDLPLIMKVRSLKGE